MKRRQKTFAGSAFAAVVLLSAPLGVFAQTPKHAVPHGKDITFGNELLTVHYHLAAGTFDVIWKDGHALLGLSSGAKLENDKALTTTAYTEHTLETGLGDGPVREYTVVSNGEGLPAFMQHFWVSSEAHAGKPWMEVQAELSPEAGTIGTRHFDAVVLKGAQSVRLKPKAALRVLHVPFDNDMWFRFNSVPVTEMKSGETYGGEEVTTIYDNTSREGFVLGSVTHDVWKTAIDVHGADGQLQDVDIYGGISSPTGVRTDTHDTLPHGVVHGENVLSPRIFIGSFHDWRDGMEAYGAENAAIHPPLKWAAGAPVGWNSWAAYAEKINQQRYLGAAQFVNDKLVADGFSRDKIVYINLDAFWSKLDAVQLADAVDDIKAMQGPDGVHFEPGIYWTPFAYWSDDLDAYVEGTNMKYRYRDILLKGADGVPLPKVDGGRAIDPSHPGAKMRTDYYMKRFQEMGFAYLKIDFLTHGSLEGAHFDPAVQTGTQAYNLGMAEVVKANTKPMFLSLSIAPLFPSGYGNARRLSCDTKGHISGGDQTTEYMLNSLTYGWWTDKNLYITDPDHVVLGDKADNGARSVVEGQSRLLSAIISGGMILDSSRLADDPQAQEFAPQVYNHPELLKVAAEGKIFRPLEGDTGDKAANVFMRKTEDGVYLALFNYDDKQAQTIHVPLARVDTALATSSALVVKDVSSGKTLPKARREVSVELPAAGSILIEVSRAH